MACLDIATMPTSTIVQVRVRSSFIYLANAVNDLSGNWAALAVILAPLILSASLCLLPDALNLQHRLAHSFETGGGHNVIYNLHDAALREAQTPYAPGAESAPPADLYPWWMTDALHLLFLLLTLLVNLVVLCELARRNEGARAPTALGEALAVYQRAARILPAFLLVILLEFLVFAVASVIFLIPFGIFLFLLDVGVRVGFDILIPLLPPGLLVLILLYFAQYALIFDDVHSWHALLYSRDLLRSRFMKVGIRIVVFLAVWSGYNSWASGAFIVASIFLGPVAVATGFVWVTVFILDVVSVAVAYFTTSFFMAAGARLYQDLIASAERVAADNGLASAETPALAAH